MRFLLLLSLWTLGLWTLDLGASTITGRIQTPAGLGRVTAVVFAPLDTPIISATNIISTTTQTATSDSSGVFSIVLTTGYYQVTIGGKTSDRFLILVPNDELIYPITELIAVFRVFPAYVLRAGDTMTGYLSLADHPTNALHAASKSYVDTVTVALAGETNTASNLGAGQGVFKSKVLKDLQFRSLIASTGIMLTSNANDIAISATNSAAVPTGTGFTHVTSGAQDAASKLVDTADINNSQVTYAKIQNVSATDKLLGRSTAGAGAVEEIPLTASGRALLDDTSASAQRTTLGLGIGAEVEAWDADLDALAGISSNGLLARTGAGTASARTITGTANEVTVTNGDGVSGNPTISLPSAITLGTVTATTLDTGRVTLSPDGLLNIVWTNLATTPLAGLTLSNAILSTAGATVQVSPAMTWTGHAWDTGGSNIVATFRASVLPVSAATPTATLKIDSSIGDLPFGSGVTIDSGGNLTMPPTASTGNIYAGASTGNIYAGSSGNLGVVTSWYLSGSSSAIIAKVWAGNAIATLQANIPQTTKTANYTNAVALDSGLRYSNIGASIAITNFLPTAVALQHYMFYVDAAQIYSIKAVGSDVIRWGSVVSAAAADIWSSTVGSALHLFSPKAGVWSVQSHEGSWTMGTYTGPGGFPIDLITDTTNPLDSTTYFVGQDVPTISTTYTIVQSRVPKNCIVKSVSIKVHCASGSSETVNFDIRINDTTDFAATTTTMNANTRDLLVTGLSQVLIEGDYIALKIVTPAWVTDPTAASFWAKLWTE